MTRIFTKRRRSNSISLKINYNNVRKKQIICILSYYYILRNIRQYEICSQIKQHSIEQLHNTKMNEEQFYDMLVINMFINYLFNLENTHFIIDYVLSLQKKNNSNEVHHCDQLREIFDVIKNYNLNLSEYEIRLICL